VGDTLYVSETPDGIRITAADPSFEAKMALAEHGGPIGACPSKICNARSLPVAL
jgi:hypothetical protein